MLGKDYVLIQEPIWNYLVKICVSISCDWEYFPENKTHMYTKRHVWKYLPIANENQMSMVG